ncbi:hypothetical protein I3842_07G005300 [Carya illinoinensis]|uniref:KIB1-4 beta-propeller domain-containing protein n=1 Tax=Carya illinoinensis TaxID=32201 RepID=A0A922EFS3_CARIL|nr:hypothetical protein I3842_07G005300 [Carya illinoinensis]
MIIFEIVKRLVNYADYVRFRSTCKSLQYMLPKTPSHQLSQVPWLMLPCNNDLSGKCRNFFSPSENRMYNFDIPKIQGKLLQGSSHGWLFAHDGFPELYLINTFTKAQIRLPPLDTFPDVLWYRPDMIDEEYLIFRERLYLSKPPIVKSASIAYFRRAFIRKIVLSSSPTSNEYTTMAIYGEFAELAFCRSGDKKWTRYLRNDPEEPDFYFDIISHEGKFYVLNERGEIWVGDGTSLPKMTRLAPSPPRSLPDHCWLVRMTSGDFVLLNRSPKWESISHNIPMLFRYKTTHFRIFKFDQKEVKWSKLTSIGNDAFFIGMNSSLSFSSQNLPIGWRGNCIYFTDAYTEGHQEGIIGGYDNGVYNLEDKSVEPLPGFVSDSLLVWPLPIWVTPNP